MFYSFFIFLSYLNVLLLIYVPRLLFVSANNQQESTGDNYDYSGDYGKSKMRTRKTAISARVTGFLGQYNNGSSLHPTVIPSA